MKGARQGNDASGSAISAPGKAFLMGEYAVLEGAPAYIAAISVRAYAHAPRAHFEESPRFDSPFVAAVLDLCEQKLGLDPQELRAQCPVVTSRGFVTGHRKLGLGSSASVTVATLAYLLAKNGRQDWVDDPQTLFDLAFAAHKQAQAGVGSGGDVAASVFGSVVRVQSAQVSPVEIPADLHLAFFDAGNPASTQNLVQAVQSKKITDAAAYEAAMAKLKAAIEVFEAALKSDNALSRHELLRQATSRHNEGLARLQAMSGALLLTPDIERIIEVAESMDLAAKPTGAGGGDLVVVFSPDQSRLDRLAATLQREPLPACSPGDRRGPKAVLELSLERSGVRKEKQLPPNSRLKHFFKRSISERRELLTQSCALPAQAFAAIDSGALGMSAAAHMIENVIGLYELPFAIAANFCVNGRDVLVPMCVEEASVVAAASNAAKMIRAGGGFHVASDPPWMIAQIQLVGEGQGSLEEQVQGIHAAQSELLDLANAAHPRLEARGGGARELEVRILDRQNLVVHVLVDCRDAMGANLLNTVAEALAPRLEQITGRTVRLRILSNLADRRVARATAEVPWEVLKTPKLEGESVARGIEEASRFAELDPYRATTHNKGIMNGVDAVVLATGNDWRAMEASAHAYAVSEGRYRPLAVWRMTPRQTLLGELSLPVAVGVVGGATRSHPGARLALDILGGPSATRLGQIIACAGLASNLAALRALATEGISRGHMALHARSVALSAGASDEDVETVARALIECGDIKLERARAIVAKLQSRDPEDTAKSGDALS